MIKAYTRNSICLFIFYIMTQKEKNIINTAIKDIKTECNTLETLYLQTRAINLRWVKQALEGKAM